MWYSIQHILPPTTISHHHISKHNIFHILTSQPQSTSDTIPHSPLFHTTPTFNIIAHFTPHHIPHHITPPHLTPQHIASFSTSVITQQSHSTLHMPHSSPPQFHTTTFHITSWLSKSCIVQHSTYQDTTFHTTPCSISHILHFSRNMSEISTFPIGTTFNIHCHHTIFHIAP